MLREPKQENPKMKKRLAWIDIDDERQVNWLAHYLAKGRWSAPETYRTQRDYIEAFLRDAKTWAENGDTGHAARNKIKQFKAAWSIWNKRHPENEDKSTWEGHYTISRKARSELKRLAKREQRSFSYVINLLLEKADEIEKLQRQLRKVELRGFKLDTGFLATLFSNDIVTEQVALATQHLKHELVKERKENRFNNHNKEIAELKTENQRLAEELESMTARVEAAEAKLADPEKLLEELTSPSSTSV